FQQFTRALLQDGGVNSGPQFGRELVVGVQNLIIKLVHLIGGIAQAPGARKVIEVASALFAGEDVVNNRAPKPDRVAGRTRAVRHAGIPADSEDGVFRVFRAETRQPQVDLGFNVPDGERRTVRLHERVPADLVRG